MEFKTSPHKLTKLFSSLDSQVKRSEDPLPKDSEHGGPYIQWLLVAQKGLGKSTTLLNSMLHKDAYRKHFNNIFLFSPTAKNDDKFNKLVDDLEEKGHYFTDCSEENIEKVIEEIQAFNEEYAHKKRRGKNKDRKANNLIVFDDCLHDLPKSSQKSVINRLFTTNRHLKTSIFTTTQKYNKLNSIIRSQADILSIWRNPQKLEREAIMKDYDIPEPVYDFATEKPNDFLHVSFFAGKPIYFKKFDKIIFEPKNIE